MKAILLPGGEVTVTFATNTPWIRDRIHSLLTDVFDSQVRVIQPEPESYSNGVVFEAFKAPLPPGVQPKKSTAQASVLEPTDDWPFLYPEHPGIPAHYLLFVGLILLSTLASLRALPAGSHMHLAYFFLGAAFFLLETSNVVSLAALRLDLGRQPLRCSAGFWFSSFSATR